MVAIFLGDHLLPYPELRQNVLHFSLALYPSKVFNRRPRSRLSYAFWRSKNTKNRGSCSTLTNSCASLRSMMVVSIPLPAQIPCRTSWNVTTLLIHVSIMASVTLQRTSRSPIPLVFEFPLGTRIRIFHPSSVGIVIFYHMNWSNSTSFIHFGGLGGGGVASFFG